MDKIYLSIEISTQQVKVCAIDDELKLIYETSLTFQKDFPSYNTDGGVIREKDNVTINSPVKMWIEAVDGILEIMKNKNFNFKNVVAISGTAQQHGSVYWNVGSLNRLRNMDPSKNLLYNLKDSFSIENSPIWMDSSTEDQCRLVEKNIGSPQNLSNITGCRAYHRITGNQILKVFSKSHDCYVNTERISLVSSFLGSLFLGDFCPIDFSDGSGMNLLDIRQKIWSPECLKAYGIDDLLNKLGNPVPSNFIIGCISEYMVKRYNFNSNCKVIAFTGDNPASLAAMAPQHGDIIISLGSSDTLFFNTKDPHPGLEGLVLVSPIQLDEYMAMLCFKNGSLTREKIARLNQVNDWTEFEKTLMDTPAGNNGNIGIYYCFPEITPNAQGIYRFNSNGDKVDRFDKATELRSLIEGQFLSMRLHASCMGLSKNSLNRILATGGASTNNSILQILSDIFGAPIYVLDVKNSACLGSAYRALHASRGGSFKDIVSAGSNKATCLCAPNSVNTQIYDEMVSSFERCLKRIVN